MPLNLAQVSNTSKENGNSNVLGFVVICAIIGFLIDQSTREKFLKNESPKLRIISSQIYQHLKELKSILKKLDCSEKKSKDRKSHKTFDDINWYQLTQDRCQRLILEMNQREYNLT